MSELFTPYKIGPIELRNRTVRSAAFEAMCPGQRPSKELFDYHTAVARGGIGMTTVAYAAVCQSGLSFENRRFFNRRLFGPVHTNALRRKILFYVFLAIFHIRLP